MILKISTTKFYSGEINNVAGLDLKVDQPQKSNLTVKFKSGQAPSEVVDIILGNLTSEEYFVEICKTAIFFCLVIEPFEYRF